MLQFSIKTVSGNMYEDKLLKNKVYHLEYQSFTPRTKLIFFHQCVPMSGLSNIKLGYYRSIFVGVSAEDIMISARYCSFIMS